MAGKPDGELPVTEDEDEPKDSSDATVEQMTKGKMLVFAGLDLMYPGLKLTIEEVEDFLRLVVGQDESEACKHSQDSDESLWKMTRQYGIMFLMRLKTMLMPIPFGERE